MVVTYSNMQLLLLRLQDNKNCTAKHFKRDKEVNCSVRQIDPFIAVRNGYHFCTGLVIANVFKPRLGKAHHFRIDGRRVRYAEGSQDGRDDGMEPLPRWITFLVARDPAVAILDDLVDHQYQGDVCSVLQDRSQCRKNEVGSGDYRCKLVLDHVCQVSGE